MQFQVPQFIEAEDKIVGPLTIRQFIYLAVGAGISFMLYLAVETWLWLILSLFIGGAALALAFVKINGRPFHLVLLSGARFVWRPHTYVWQPDQPALQKNNATMSSITRGSSLERILSGRALRAAWDSIQTGTSKKRVNARENYLAFRRPTGDRNVARRVDYR